MRRVGAEADARTAAPLREEEDGIRVEAHLSEHGHRRLAELLAARPDAWLALEAHGTEDVDCLVHYPGLRHLTVRSLRLRSWDGLRHVAGTLEDLAMGDTTLRPVSIAPMGELSALRSLVVIGPVRDAEVVARITTLESLVLRSVTLADLGPLVPLRRLRSLGLLLGGTSDLGRLPELAPLDSLELWRIRGLRDVEVLGRLPALRELRLQSMSAITRLPSLAGAVELRLLALDAMKGITDLRPVADAPALEELFLVDMPQLDAGSLRPLVGHPTLRRGIWGFGSTRRNIAAYELLPLGDPPYGWSESSAGGS